MYFIVSTALESRWTSAARVPGMTAVTRPIRQAASYVALSTIWQDAVGR